MSTYLATCHTPDNNDADRRIQGLGGPGWRDNIDNIIRAIDAGHMFYTSPPSGNGQRIITAVRNGRRYLKTEADYVEPNNILSLPRCP
jgi:hypothetical protein